MAAMVNMNLNNMLNVKDSRWLQLEVCREYQRSKCSRSDTECKFAHPPPSVEVQNGRVVACYDSIKGRCNREKPPCKYFHPPQHLKDQLLINGRNHLALKNALMLQMGMSPGQHILPGQMQTIPTSCASSIGGFAHHHVVPMQAAAPYLAAAGIPQLTAQSAYSPYAASPAMLQVVGPEGVSSMMGYAPAPATKLQRSDRIETYPGMVQGYKRSAGDKSGLPVYQPSAAAAGASAAAAAYHQAQAQAIMQLQQPFVPVSCEYPSTQPHVATPATATASTNSNSSNNVSPSAGGVTSSTGTSTAATAAAPTITNPQTNELIIPASSVSSLFNESSSSPNSITVNASSQSSQFINGSTATGLETSVSVNSLEPSLHTSPSDSTAMSGSASQETSHLLTWTYGGGGVKRDCPTPTRDRETQHQSALANSLGAVASMAYSFPSSSIAFSFPSSSATYSLSSISAAAPTQSAAAIVSSGMSPSLAYPNLSALAYTGVSLNKQAQQSLASAAAAAANPSVSVAAGLQYPYQALLNTQAGQAFLHPAYASLAAGGTGTPFPGANVAGFSNAAASAVGLPSFQSMAAAAAAAGQGVGFSALPGLAGLHAGAAGNLFAGNPYFPGAPGLQAVYGAAAAGQGLQFGGVTGVVPSQYMALGMPTGAVTGGVGGVGISSAAAAAAAMASATGLPQPYKKMRTI